MRKDIWWKAPPLAGKFMWKKGGIFGRWIPVGERAVCMGFHADKKTYSTCWKLTLSVHFKLFSVQKSISSNSEDGRNLNYCMRENKYRTHYVVAKPLGGPWQKGFSFSERAMISLDPGCNVVQRRWKWSPLFNWMLLNWGPQLRKFD